jgi:branched-chain amino acid transport system substrate-binding protein
VGKVVIAHEEGVWGTTTADICASVITPLGHQVVAKIPFKAGSPDFSSVIAQAKRNVHDYLVVFTYGNDANVFIPQMKQLNYNPKFNIFAIGGWPDNFGKLPESEYIGVAGMWFPEWKRKESQDFVKSYVKTNNGVTPKQYWSPLAYTTLMTVAESINRAGSADKKAIAKALQTGKWNTVLGPLKFTKSKYGINDGYDYEIAMQWRKGQMEVVWPKNLETMKAVYPVPAWDKR